MFSNLCLLGRNKRYEIPKGNRETFNTNVDDYDAVDIGRFGLDSLENVFEISLCISQNSVIIVTSFPGIQKRAALEKEKNLLHHIKVMAVLMLRIKSGNQLCHKN